MSRIRKLSLLIQNKNHECLNELIFSKFFCDNLKARPIHEQLGLEIDYFVPFDFSKTIKLLVLTVLLNLMATLYNYIMLTSAFFILNLVTGPIFMFR